MARHRGGERAWADWPRRSPAHGAYVPRADVATAHRPFRAAPLFASADPFWCPAYLLTKALVGKKRQAAAHAGASGPRLRAPASPPCEPTTDRPGSSISPFGGYAHAAWAARPPGDTPVRRRRAGGERSAAGWAGRKLMRKVRAKIGRHRRPAPARFFSRLGPGTVPRRQERGSGGLVASAAAARQICGADKPGLPPAIEEALPIVKWSGCRQADLKRAERIAMTIRLSWRGRGHRFNRICDGLKTGFRPVT